ncbi:MAG: TIGR03032 family protein, partial [Stenotrophomonas sp.]
MSEQADAVLNSVTNDGTQAPANEAASEKTNDPAQMIVQKSCSRGLFDWLSSNKVSLAISSYQSGRVYLVG